VPAQPAATGWTWFLLGHDRESGVGVAEDSAAIVDLEQLSTGATLTHDVCCGDVAVQQVAENATGVRDGGDDAFGVGRNGVHNALLE